MNIRKFPLFSEIQKLQNFHSPEKKKAFSVTLNLHMASSSAHKNRLHAINNRPTYFALCLLDRSHSCLNKALSDIKPHTSWIFIFWGRQKAFNSATVDLNMPSCEPNKSPLYTRYFSLFFSSPAAEF